MLPEHNLRIHLVRTHAVHKDEVGMSGAKLCKASLKQLERPFTVRLVAFGHEKYVGTSMFEKMAQLGLRFA